MSILDPSPGTRIGLVERWFADHRDDVCDLLANRLQGYDVDDLSKTARTAMAEAIEAYRARLHLSVVRVLLPEFERFARALIIDKTKKVHQ